MSSTCWELFLMGVRERLRELRRKYKMSREQLAAKSGVSYPYLAGLESGVRENPSLDILGKLADAFGISIDELVGRKTPKKK